MMKGIFFFFIFIILLGCTSSPDDLEPVATHPLSTVYPPECQENEIKIETCPDGNTTYMSENCVDGKWEMVKYFRDPCAPLPKAVSNFEECVEAGNPVMESYPRQCRTPDGRLFVEELEEGALLPSEGG